MQQVLLTFWEEHSGLLHATSRANRSRCTSAARGCGQFAPIPLHRIGHCLPLHECPHQPELACRPAWV